MKFAGDPGVQTGCDSRLYREEERKVPFRLSFWALFTSPAWCFSSPPARVHPHLGQLFFPGLGRTFIFDIPALLCLFPQGREPQADSPLSVDPDTGFDLRTMRSHPELKSTVWLSHPGVPSLPPVLILSGFQVKDLFRPNTFWLSG